MGTSQAARASRHMQTGHERANSAAAPAPKPATNPRGKRRYLPAVQLAETLLRVTNSAISPIIVTAMVK